MIQLVLEDLGQQSLALPREGPAVAGLAPDQDRADALDLPANRRVLVKPVLRKYGDPPDKQEKATQTVLEQAEALSEAWAIA